MLEKVLGLEIKKQSEKAKWQKRGRNFKEGE